MKEKNLRFLFCCCDDTKDKSIQTLTFSTGITSLRDEFNLDKLRPSSKPQRIKRRTKSHCVKYIFLLYTHTFCSSVPPREN